MLISENGLATHPCPFDQIREELRIAQDSARAHEAQAKALQAEVERFSALLQEETASKEEIARRMDHINDELRGKTKNIHDEATAASEARRECTLFKQREKALREELSRALAAKDQVAEQLSVQHRAMSTRAKRYNELESMARTYERERDVAMEKLADLEATQGSSSQALSTLEISAAERGVRVKELESANEVRCSFCLLSLALSPSAPLLKTENPSLRSLRGNSRWCKPITARSRSGTRTERLHSRKRGLSSKSYDQRQRACAQSK